MLEKIPDIQEITDLIGEQLYNVWTKLCELIESKYEMEQLWNSGGKDWKFEYKYRRGGKTLCGLYARENCISFMVILGKAEREKFEADRQSFSDTILKIYDETKTYHDGKWMMVELTDNSLFDDIEKLLLIKRRPNKK